MLCILCLEFEAIPEMTLMNTTFIEFLLMQENAAEERKAWQFAFEETFNRLWDNEHDAVYDNWRELYGVSDK